RTRPAPRFLYNTAESECCKSKSLLVRSRQGGFISQNCLHCGKSGYVRPNHLPEVECDFCGVSLGVRKLDDTNYSYLCGQCGRHWDSPRSCHIGPISHAPAPPIVAMSAKI